MDILNKEKLQNVSTNMFGKNLIYYNKINSTNIKAMNRLKNENIKEGCVFIAATQTEGRGTGDKRWESDQRGSMLTSVIVHYPFRKNPLSFVPAVAIARVLRNMYKVDAYLKWPNDILVNKRKICGILCQNQTQPNGKTACVVGVGVNIKQKKFPDYIKNKAISLSMITDKEESVEEFYKNYIEEFEKVYLSDSNIVSEWLQYTNMIGKRIKLMEEGKVIEATVDGVTDEGYLKIQDDSGRTYTKISSTLLDIDFDY